MQEPSDAASCCSAASTPNGGAGGPWRLVMTGHSLGAGIAAFAAMYLHAALPDTDVSAWCYSPPGWLMTPQLAEWSQSFVTSVIINKDVVPRCVPIASNPQMGQRLIGRGAGRAVVRLCARRTHDRDTALPNAWACAVASNHGQVSLMLKPPHTTVLHGEERFVPATPRNQHTAVWDTLVLCYALSAIFGGLSHSSGSCRPCSAGRGNATPVPGAMDFIPRYMAYDR